MLVPDAKFQTEFRDVQTVLVDDDVGPYQVVGVGLKAGRSSNMKKKIIKKNYIFLTKSKQFNRMEKRKSVSN